MANLFDALGSADARRLVEHLANDPNADLREKSEFPGKDHWFGAEMNHLTALERAVEQGWVADVGVLLRAGHYVSSELDRALTWAFEGAKENPQASIQCARLLFEAGASRLDAAEEKRRDAENEPQTTRETTWTGPPILRDLVEAGLADCAEALAAHCTTRGVDLAVRDAGLRHFAEDEHQATWQDWSLSMSEEEEPEQREQRWRDFTRTVERLAPFGTPQGTQAARAHIAWREHRDDLGAMCRAIDQRDPAALEQLLVAGAPAHIAHPNGRQHDREEMHEPPLAFAARAGSAPCVEVLLRWGADPAFAYTTRRDEPPSAPLVAACESLRPWEGLAEHAATIEALAPFASPSLLEGALRAVGKEMARRSLPLETGDGADCTADCERVFDALFAGLADGRSRRGEHSQWLALSWAVHGEDEAAIEQHLASHPECDVNAQDAIGETALMRAARFACFDAGRQLLAAGANPNLANSEGETAVSLFLSRLHEGSLMSRAPEESIQFVDSLLSASARSDAAGGASTEASPEATCERQCDETLQFALRLGYARLVEAVAPRCAPAARDAIATEWAMADDLHSRALYRPPGGDDTLAAAGALLPHLRGHAESLLRARRDHDADSVRADRMFEAANKGDVQAVEELLADGCPANMAARDGRRGVRTPFLKAIQARRFDVARALWRGGADPAIGVDPFDYLICNQRGARDLAGAVARVLPAAQIEASLRDTLRPRLANTTCAGLSWGEQVEGLLGLLPDSDARDAFEDKAIQIARDAFPAAPLAQTLPITAARLEREQLQSEMLAVADTATAAPAEPCATARIDDGPSHQRNQAVAFLAACNSAQANDRGDTGLMIAVRDHGPGLVEALVPLSNPLALNDAGESAFAIAIKGKKFDCADALAPHSNPVEVARAFERTGAEKMPRWAARLEDAAGAKEARVAKAERDGAEAIERIAHAVATTPAETPQAALAKPRAMRL